MKTLQIIIIALLISVSFSACKKCKKEDPRARIINNGTKMVSVQIMTTGGNTENINNIAPGTTSEYRSYAPGDVTFTITVDNYNKYTKTISMAHCYEYDIAIDANNQIVSTPTDRNN